ncbi:hypothetical protein [Kribbella sp. C-35]|uniref:hypothetical protein n=1 Tax=Kribbella sp. C-35 TaxID=2789276 RepID=UPI00397B5509
MDRLDRRLRRLAAAAPSSAGFSASTKISGSWTFKSSAVGADKWTYLPLSSFSFAPAVDLAKARRAVSRTWCRSV